MTQHNGTPLTEYLIDQQPSLAVVLRQKIGSQNTHYVHGLRGIQSQHDGAGWSDAVSDGLGSVRGWLDLAQVFGDIMNYDPYGVPDASVVGYGFTGEMTDANGLVYLRARYYDPNVGNFVSLDPFEGLNYKPQSINRYGYVNGNPLNYIDPSGLFGEKPPTCGEEIDEKCCGLDVTEWFVYEIMRHSVMVDDHFRRLKDLLIEDYSVIPGLEDTFILPIFAQYARAIPHKWLNFNQLPSSGCPSGDTCRTSVTLCGKCIDRSELGNIIFGMAGAIAQIPHTILEFAGYHVARGMQGHAEQASVGIGYYLGENYRITDVSNSNSLCSFLTSTDSMSVRTWSIPNSAPWQWRYINSGDASANCKPCTTKLPDSDSFVTFFAVSEIEAGKSIYADKNNLEFYIDQILDVNFLDPLLLGDLYNPHSNRDLMPRLCREIPSYVHPDFWECDSF